MNYSFAFRKLILEKYPNKEITQVDLSKHLGISEAYFSQIMNGRQPSRSLISKFCKVMKVPEIVFVWYATEEKDVQPNKREAFKELNPAVNALIAELIAVSPKQSSKQSKK